jgi:hypothetical protein
MAPRWARLVAAGLVPGLLGGCYSYRPLPAPPPPETRVSVVLSDLGRLETARAIGPGTERVEGRMVATDDSAYLLAVSSV